MFPPNRRVVAIAAACLAVATAFSAQTPATRSGIREPAFSPDGKRLAVSWLDELWTMIQTGVMKRRSSRPAAAGSANAIRLGAGWTVDRLQRR